MAIQTIINPSGDMYAAVTTDYVAPGAIPKQEQTPFLYQPASQITQQQQGGSGSTLDPDEARAIRNRQINAQRLNN